MTRFPPFKAADGAVNRRSWSTLFLGSLLALSLIASSCGVSRSAPADVALDADQVDEEESAPGEAGESATTPTTSVEPVPTPSTAPAGEIAVTADFGDGEVWELTHGELNDVIIPTWESQEFVDLAFGGGVPPGFFPGVTYEHLVGEVLTRELADLDASVDTADTDAARQSLAELVAGWFPAAADPGAEAERLFDEVPYLPFVVDQQAKQTAFGEALTESGELTVDAPCVRHILLDDETAAQEVLDLLNDGGDFAALAAERSTGPTGPTGGDLGCAPSSGYVPEFAAAVDSATLGEYVGPVQTQFGWHVLVVDRYEESTQNPGDVIGQRVRARLEGATIDVDPRVGTWDPVNLTITPVDGE